MVREAIGDAKTLRDFFGDPAGLAVACIKKTMDHYHRRFIELSPFLCLATSDAAGQPYVSPKGDAPGFVSCLDERTLLIPDRPGNNKVESFSCIVENPKVSIVFFVPGLSETLRVLGRAELTTDLELREMGVVRGSTPKIATRVEVDTVYFHCGKAVVRSQLWKDESRLERDQFPRFGEILKMQCDLDASVEETDGVIEEMYKNGLY